jgi:hypothetical protein
MAFVLSPRIRENGYELILPKVSIVILKMTHLGSGGKIKLKIVVVKLSFTWGPIV